MVGFENKIFKRFYQKNIRYWTHFNSCCILINLLRRSPPTKSKNILSNLTRKDPWYSNHTKLALEPQTNKLFVDTSFQANFFHLFVYSSYQAKLKTVITAITIAIVTIVTSTRECYERAVQLLYCRLKGKRKTRIKLELRNWMHMENLLIILSWKSRTFSQGKRKIVDFCCFSYYSVHHTFHHK